MILGQFSTKDILKLAKELETNARSAATLTLNWDGAAVVRFTYKNDKQDYVDVSIFECERSGNKVPTISRTDNL